MKTDEILATPAPSGRLHPLSVEAYHVLGEMGFLPKNTELLYGLVYTKMPKSPIHAVLITRLMKAFASLPEGLFWVRSEQPITCGDSEPEPDVSIIAGKADDFTREHPKTAALVVEVCVTSHEYDRSKLRAYAAAGVQECWLILQPERVVEVFRAPIGGAYTQKSMIDGAGKLAAAVAPDVTIDLEQLFRH